MTETDDRRSAVLIVSTVPGAEEKLRALVGQGARAKVVVPVVGEGLVGWLANDEQAFARAQDEAERLGRRLPADAVETGAGESNIALAIQDALAEFPADEVIVVTSVDDEPVVTDGLSRLQVPLDGVPIRIVTLEHGSSAVE